MVRVRLHNSVSLISGEAIEGWVGLRVFGGLWRKQNVCVNGKSNSDFRSFST